MFSFKNNNLVDNLDQSQVSERRRFLRTAVFAGVAGVAPSSVFAKTSHKKQQDKSLKLLNLHTGERVNAVYWSNGQYVRENLLRINKVLRDHRTNEIKTMDPRLFDTLDVLQQRLGYKKELHVISGYRSPKTNAMLRKRSSGVAKNSFHTRGMAIDIRVPGVSTRYVRDAAKSMKRGGVGYYAKSNFVHVDLGRVRSW